MHLVQVGVTRADCIGGTIRRRLGWRRVPEVGTEIDLHSASTEDTYRRVISEHTVVKTFTSANLCLRTRSWWKKTQ
jgi:hypothetical protein